MQFNQCHIQRFMSKVINVLADEVPIMIRVESQDNESNHLLR